MDRTIKIALTVGIGVVLIVSATAVAYSVTKNSPEVYSPYSYIPLNSSVVAWVSYNGTGLFVFQSNNSTAILLSSVGIEAGNISLASGNSSFSLPISYNSTYKGFQIFSVNVSSAIAQLIHFNSSFSSNLNFSNLTVYAYSTSGGSVVLGSYSGVKDSINAFNSGKDFSSKSKFITQDENLSFYYSPSNNTLPFSYAWGGMNNTSLYAYIELNNQGTFNFTGLLTYEGFEVKSVSSHELEISYGAGNISSLIEKLSSMG